MREEWLRLETPETFAEGVLPPVRFPDIPANIASAWPN